MPRLSHDQTAITAKHRIDKQIFALALPALGSLVAEPLFLLGDTVMVGHLGAANLAGLGVAAAVVTTVVGLTVFITFAITPLVAHNLGARRFRDAAAASVTGLWAASALGLLFGLLIWLFAEPIVAWFLPDAGVGSGVTSFDAALSYLQISCFGLPAMLICFALTGALRGYQDTRTPLYVSTLAAILNIGINWVLIYPLQLGIAGSALGTVIVQWLMVLTYLWFVAQRIRGTGARLTPRRDLLLKFGHSSGWLLLRTTGMRVVLVLSLAAITLKGDEATAAYQIGNTVVTVAAFALDALAIAAQALIAKNLGAADPVTVRLVTNRCMHWGWITGFVAAAIVLVVAWTCAPLFTSDASVQLLVALSLSIAALGQPFAAAAFTLDGILIGANDVKYMGIFATLNVLVYTPIVLFFYLTPDARSATAQLLWLLGTYNFWYMGLRVLPLWVRIRGTAWMRLPA